MEAARTLLIDIERTPNVVHRWDLRDPSPTSLDQLIEPARMLCFAALWLDEKKPVFHAGDGMVEEARGLLNEADIVVGFNSNRFDLPVINGEIAMAGLSPPSPYLKVDVYRESRKAFLFPSHKLDYILKTFQLRGKVKHEGHPLWVKCMEGDKSAWDRMRRYNIGDVVRLKPAYLTIRPWMKSHPNLALIQGKDGCPRCGSGRLQKHGYAYTSVGKFQRYLCVRCGYCCRTGRRLAGSDVRGIA